MIFGLLTSEAYRAPSVVWEKWIDVSDIVAAGPDLLIKQSKPGRNTYVVLDSETGKPLLEQSDCVARLSNGKLLTLRNGVKSTFEAWQLRPPTKLWEYQIDSKTALGEIVGERFYYTDADALRVLNLTTREVEQSRIMDRFDYMPTPVHATSNRVYFNPNGHEIYGLNPENLQDGWRNYCDCFVRYADDFGFVGTGSLCWCMAIVGVDGKNVAPKALAMTHYQFGDGTPAVSRNFVVFGGQLLTYESPPRKPDSQGQYIYGPYLLAFRRSDGKELWRVSMYAIGVYARNPAPVIVDDKVVTFGYNTRNKKGEWTLQVRDLEKGVLVWSSPTQDVKDTHLVSNGSTFFVYNKGHLSAMRLRR